MGYVFPDAGRDGLRLCDHRVVPWTAADRTALGLGGLRSGPRRSGDGDNAGVAGPRFRPLHLLSASDRQPVLLHRRRARGRRIVDLGRADVDQSARLEESQSGPARAAGDVRQCRRLLSLGVDCGRRGARASVAAHSRRAWPDLDDQCRAGARVLLLDAARHRLFLADSDLYRLLHDPAARDRRQDLQRHDDAARLHHVPGRRDADRHPSHVWRPAGRRGLQIHPLHIHRAGRASDPDHGLHHLRFGRDRGAAARRARACSAGSRRCPGTTRSCSPRPSRS